MIIVINTQSYSTAYTPFIINSFVELATQQKQHQYIFWLTQPTTIEIPSNCSIQIVREIPTNTLRQKYWYNYKIPSLLKKCKATHYFNLAGIISNRTTVAQYLFLSLPVHEDAIILPIHLQNYYGKNAEEQLNKAKQIITFSPQEKSKIDNYFPPLANKTSVFPLAASTIFTTLFWKQQEEVKIKYTNGNSYFLAYCPSITKDEFTTLLKAFTQFKQWQKSSMHLVIYCSTVSYQIQDLLNSYKYKADVQLMHNVPQQDYADVLASAYAFIYPDTQQYLPLPVLEAMHCQVPTIVSKQLSSILASKSTLVDFNDIKSISSELILMYKDESYRNKLIQEGIAFSLNYNWDITNHELSKIVSEAEF
jgi:glycosyltransferase involved in cell wall biosynthesis